MDEAPEPVHIVGHSYGGALALRVTLQRPQKVASLTLYEPSCFQLLDELGEPGDAAMSEIGVVAGAVADLVARGHGEAAVRVHFDVQADASEAGIRALAMPQTSPSAWRGCWLARPLEQGDQHITNDQVNISSL